MAKKKLTPDEIDEIRRGLEDIQRDVRALIEIVRAEIERKRVS